MLMAIWAAGLATRASALRACKWGGIACLLQAARMTVGNIASLTVANKGLVAAVAWFVGASLFPILMAVAGTRLLRGNGLIWGSAALAMLVFDFLVYGQELASVQAITSVCVKAALVALIINGLRGALVLRNMDSSDLRTST
ncbi:MAG TPA: hypothetical protein VN157_18105 [Caulobacter sp.]|nr:hypothetical protein [Caulobacter sp.]